MANLISRLRARIEQGDLDADTEQLLRDAAAALARAAPGLKPVDFADTSSIPGGETREALLAAALDHAECVGCMDFLELVPGTSPQLVVAYGRPLSIINVLADQEGTNR
jgi:hypothetical protein